MPLTVCPFTYIHLKLILDDMPLASSTVELRLTRAEVFDVALYPINSDHLIASNSGNLSFFKFFRFICLVAFSLGLCPLAYMFSVEVLHH